MIDLTFTPILGIAPILAAAGAVIMSALAGAFTWVFAKLAEFFTKKAVAIALVTAFLAAISIIPVTIWAVAESSGIALGILTSDPFSSAPDPIPWVISLIDLFVPIKFVVTTATVILLMRFTAVNLTTVYAAIGKMISSRT